MGGVGRFSQAKSSAVLEFTGMADCFSRTLTTSAVAGVATTEGNIIQLTITPNSAVSAATVVNPVISGQALGGYTATTSAADFGAIPAVTFAAGATAAQTVNITVASDTTVEGIEAYKIALLNSAGVEVATALTGIVTDAANTGNTGIPFTLTTGVDALTNFTGGAGNDTFTGPIDSWSILDAIDGGAGTDTLTVSTTATAAPTGATVVNVETMNVSTTGAGYTINTTTYTGLTSLTVSDATQGAISVTSAATTAANVAATGNGAVTVIGTGGVVTVTAGTGQVDIGQTAVANAITTATVSGGTAVNITDRSGTSAATGSVLTTVSVSNATAGAIAITGNGITTLNLTSQTADASDATITAAAGTRALTVNLNGVVSAANQIVVTDQTATTVNVNAVNAASSAVNIVSGAATTVNVNANVALGITALTAGVATVVNVSGTARTTITGDTFASNAVVNSISTGGVTITQALTANQQFVGTASSGADTISLATGMTTAITTGDGNDTVIYGGPVGTGGSVNAGVGTDIISMTTAQAVAAVASSVFNSKYTNFETLTISDALGVASDINLAGINGVSKVVLAGGGGHLTNAYLRSFQDNGTLQLTADATGVTLDVTNALFNAANIVNLQLTKTLAPLVAGTITTPGVETVNIAVADASTASTGSAAVIHTLTLVDTSATTVTVTGNNGLNLTNTGNTAITSFNASGVVANGTAGADTDANLGVTFLSANTTATALVTITGGAGADVLTGVGALDSISGGLGADTIMGGAGADTLTGGAGADTFRYDVIADAVGAAGINVDRFTDFVAGTDKINLKSAGGGNAGLLNGVTLTTGAAAAAIAAAPIANATTVASISDVYTALAAYTTLTASAGNGSTVVAQVYTFANGAAAGTYLVVNDASAGFQAANDLVINLTGLSGTLSASDFTFLNI